MIRARTTHNAPDGLPSATDLPARSPLGLCYHQWEEVEVEDGDREGIMAVGGLYRSKRHRIIGGVAGGMAERFGLPVILVRLLWLILLLPGGLPGVVPYLICWALIPSEERRNESGYKHFSK